MRREEEGERGQKEVADEQRNKPKTKPLLILLVSGVG